MKFTEIIKNFLGIGGVKLMLAVPEQAPKQDGTLRGKLIVTTKVRKEIDNLKIEMKEKWSFGRGEEKTVKFFTLGMAEIPSGFTIVPNEQKEFSFDLDYKLIKSKNDMDKDKGGIMKGLGKAGAFLDGEKSTFFINAVASVKGVAFPPTDKRDIVLK